jgi:hypothetical protein
VPQRYEPDSIHDQSKDEIYLMSNETGLDSAPEEIKLAVDLIFLFESNEIDPKVALEALEIVKGDLLKKIDSE